jgi:glycerol transport system ATP-binding protein
VFSEPPINVVNATKRGRRIELQAGTSWELPAALGAFADGPLQVGLRPHHVYPTTAATGTHVTGRVLISEISGSESVVHFDLAGDTWVSLSSGVHNYPVGSSAQFALDVQRAMYFAPNGNRLAGSGA